MSSTMPPLLDEAVSIARRAAEEILAAYRPGMATRIKEDRSPVCDADERAAAVIVDALAALTPEYPIVCEESADRRGAAETTGRFWLVDPLDGTKEFLAGHHEFTVNIALVEGGVPILGVVLAPAFGRVFAGAAGNGALVEENGERRRLACRVPPAEGLTVVASRSHGDVDAMAAFLRGRHVARIVNAGSSLKFCMVAAGDADLYPRLGTTMEWDTAAGHAVLSAAGGRVSCVDGVALRYGKPGLVNPHFLAAGL
jgi:3'(2'), 5'-bisphosphate nucleotidase